MFIHFSVSRIALSGEIISGSGIGVGEGVIVDVAVGAGDAVGVCAWQATRRINNGIVALMKIENLMLYPRDLVCLYL
jgi:hypothetical protein